jgi:hypothetical protein
MTVNWLLLERYAAGELSSDEVDRVDAMWGEDPATAAALETIRTDAQPVPPLDLSRPPSMLPLPEPDAVPDTADAPGPVPLEALPSRSARASRPMGRLWRLAGGGLALAAAALLLVGVWPALDTVRTKGGAVHLMVETADGILAPGATIDADQRIQLRITTGAGPQTYRLTDNGELVDEARIEGGNRVRLPGAWTLEPGPHTLCITVEDERACTEVIAQPAPR